MGFSQYPKTTRQNNTVCVCVCVYVFQLCMCLMCFCSPLLCTLQLLQREDIDFSATGTLAILESRVLNWNHCVLLFGMSYWLSPVFHGPEWTIVASTASRVQNRILVLFFVLFSFFHQGMETNPAQTDVIFSQHCGMNRRCLQQKPEGWACGSGVGGKQRHFLWTARAWTASRVNTGSLCAAGQWRNNNRKEKKRLSNYWSARFTSLIIS